MDRRDPPRIGIGESLIDEGADCACRPDPAAPAGWGRGAGNDARATAGRVSSGGAGLVTLLVYLGHLTVVSVVRWLHAQSHYDVPFDQIELAGPPPAWYRGGAKGFLDQVRRGAGIGEHVAMLDLPPDRLATVFKTNGWVEEVAKVSYLPGKIRVKLKYREPVGLVMLADRQQRLVDERGVLLAADDVDPWCWDRSSESRGARNWRNRRTLGRAYRGNRGAARARSSG